MRNLLPSSFDATLILRIWAWLFAFSGFIVYFFYGISLYLFLAAVVSLLAAAALGGVIQVISGVPGRLFMGHNSALTTDQKLRPELDKIVHHYRKGSHQQARRLLREILENHPDHGEALVWKAKVALAGEGDRQVARSTLRKVVDNRSNKKEIRVWAKTLLDEIALDKED